jgi:hypothetical protein
MIRKILLAVMLAAGFSSAAFAQASFTVKDSASVTQTFKSFNCSANICSLAVPADITGAAFGTPANPFFFNTSVTLTATIANTVTITSTSAVQPTTVLNAVPISGTVTISSNSAVQPVNVLNTVTVSAFNASPLPVAVLGTNTLSVNQIGTATVSTASALQPVTGTVNAVQSGNWPVRLQDGSGNTIASTASALNVQCANCSGSGVSTVDTATYQAGVSNFVGFGGAYLTSNTTNPLTIGHQGFAQLTQFRALETNLVNSTGVEIATTTNPLSMTVIGTASVNCSNCSGSGVSTTDTATFNPGISQFVGVGGAYLTSNTTNPLTVGHQGFAQLTQFRAMMTNLVNSAGTEVGTGTNPLSVNVANANANGQALMANSSPVVIASNQSTLSAQVIGSSTTLSVAVVGTNSLTTNVTGTVTITSNSAVQPATVLNTVVITGNSSLLPVAVFGTNTISVSQIGTATVSTNSAVQPTTVLNTVPITGTVALSSSVGDPCTFTTKSSTPLAASGGALTQILVPGSASKRIYGCSFVAIGGSAGSFSLIEGTGATCGTSTAAVLGGTTALSGVNLAANGGLTLGSGHGTVAQTATNGNNLCLTSSVTPTVAGNFVYVVQ